VSRASLVLLAVLAPWMTYRSSLADDDPRTATPSATGAERGELSPSLDRSVRKKLTACGINALYLFLRTYARPVTYEQVARQIKEGSRGASMLQMNEVAKEMGLATRVRRYTMDDLERCRLPVLAHFKQGINPQEMPDDPEAPVDPAGYFALIVGVNDLSVRIIDGNLGATREMMKVKFPIYWSGYVLEPIEEDIGWGRWSALSIVAAWVAIAFILFRRRSVGLRARLSTGVAASLIGLAALGSPPPALAVEQPARDSSPGRIWRIARNDGVNCLYLQLAILRHEVDFAQLVESVQPGRGSVTLLTLKEAAGRHGLPMRIRQCRPDDLERLPMPVIALMDEPRGGGAFALICQLDEQYCRLITGSTATYSEMPIDDFRHAWSGFVLEPAPDGGSWLRALVGGPVLIAGYCWWRWRRGTRRSPVRPSGVPDAESSDDLRGSPTRGRDATPVLSESRTSVAGRLPEAMSPGIS
jgi:hypothetical protein